MTLVGGPRRCTIPISGAKLLKTGQTTIYATGDDGDIQAGRDVDFFTLAVNNPFGNTYRFTGINGGYYDITTNAFYLSDGSAAVIATAFPESVMIDWNQYDGSTVLGYYTDLGQTSVGYQEQWATAVASCNAFSTVSYASGWRMGNRQEYATLMHDEAVGSPVNINWCFQYQPLGVTSLRFWTSTTFQQNPSLAYRVEGSGLFAFQDKTTATSMRIWPVRRFTVTGTTIL